MSAQSAMILVIMVAAAMSAGHADAITCQQAIATLSPCENYLVNPSYKLTPQCCQAAATLNNMVHDKPDLRNSCDCLKQAAAALHVIVDRAMSLPNDCHIQVPVPIDPNVDCSRI